MKKFRTKSRKNVSSPFDSSSPLVGKVEFTEDEVALCRIEELLKEIRDLIKKSCHQLKSKHWTGTYSL